MSVLRVALATKNPGKVREIAQILAEAPIDLVAPDPAWIAPPEDDATYRGNALIKARSLASLASLPLLADESVCELLALRVEGVPDDRRSSY